MIPILIVCYIRPEKLRHILEVLKNSEAEIYIFIDRAREINAELNSQVNEVAMAYASSLNVKVKWSNESYGVARGVPAAIDWAFSHVDELVILEDDCLPSEHAINFFQNQRALINKSVVMSCATSPWRKQSLERVVGLSSYPLIWGWSTNKVAWMKISRLLGREVPYLRILKTVLLHPSRTLAICYFSAAVIRIRLKKLAAWDCAIALEMLLSNYSAIIPDKSMVENSGNDGVGSHEGIAVEAGSEIVSKKAQGPASNQLDTSQEFKKKIDKEIEESIYNFRFRHYFSPIKALLF